MSLDSDKGRDLESNEEVAGALAALRRARQRAEEVAAATGTALIQSVNGKPTRVQPRRREDQVPPK